MSVTQEPLETPWRRVAAQCGLYRFWDVPLLVLPLLWASLLAAKGDMDIWRLLALILAVLFARSAGVWLYDPEAPALSQLPRERRPFALLLGVGALCFAVPLGLVGIWVPMAGVFTALWFSLRRHSYLAEPVLAFGLAVLLIAGWQTQGGMPGKTMGLLFLTAYLWIVSALISIGRRQPMRDATLAGVAGTHAPLVSFALKVAAVIAFILVGKNAGLGVFHLLSCGIAVALAAYQLFLAKRQRDSAFTLELWFGVTIFSGIAFHYLCASQR